MQKLLGHAIALSALAVAGSASATVIYQTGFEPPTYVNGNLTGQDGWQQFGGTTVTVQNTIVKSGAQAAIVDGSNASSQSGPYRSSPTALPMISMSADILLTSGSAQRAWQFSAIGAGLIGFSGGIDINPNGDILAITNGFPVIASGFTRDVWHNVDIRLNYTTQSYSILLDGVTLASNLAFCGSNGACTNAFLPNYDTLIFDTFGARGDDNGAIDNVLVQTFAAGGVPEPESWALLIAGFGLVGASLRRRRSTSVAA